MTSYIDIHTHKQHAGHKEDNISIYSFRLGIDNHIPPAPFSAGIHPWDVANDWDYDTMLDNLNNMNIVAIGETGLDFHHDNATKSQQQYLFERQLDIARQRGLPVIIHCVKAFEPTMSVLRTYSLPAVIFHGYTGSLEQTRKVKNAGYYLSLGTTSLDSARTINGLNDFPYERILLETDDSGKEIEDIYRTASIALNIPPEELKNHIYKNFKTLFPNL